VPPFAIDADQEPPLTLGAPIMAQAQASHSPAHPNQGHLSSTSQMPFNIPGASTTTENAARWDQTCAAAAQWTALGIVEPKDQNRESVLMEWVRRDSGVFYCNVPTSDGHCRVSNAKKDRILSHVRKDHLNFRPFHCHGVCGNPEW